MRKLVVLIELVSLALVAVIASSAGIVSLSGEAGKHNRASYHTHGKIELVGIALVKNKTAIILLVNGRRTSPIVIPDDRPIDETFNQIIAVRINAQSSEIVLAGSRPWDRSLTFTYEE